MSKFQKVRHLVVTSGDTDGIGLEVTLKALARWPSDRACRFSVFLARIPPHLRNLQLRAQRNLGKRLEFVYSHESPADWVDAAARLCLERTADAMVTAPLSKELIVKSGRKEIGHTEILKRISKTKHVHMAFLGQHFNVLLATPHIPFKDVSRRLTVKELMLALRAADGLRRSLGAHQGRKPIGLVGLNPHAGENGLLGNEEQATYAHALSRAKGLRIPIAGPLVPDAAFLKANWPRYSVYVSPYHDQGLIPFKLVHGHSSGVHISLGLPFIRTSVDHGTAKDIYGKNIADAGSMLDALLWANEFARKGKLWPINR